MAREEETKEWDLDDLVKALRDAIDAKLIEGRKKKRRKRKTRKRRRRTKRRVTVSRKKARKILRDGEIRGKPLTKRQRRFFGISSCFLIKGWIAGGKKPRK